MLMAPSLWTRRARRAVAAAQLLAFAGALMFDGGSHRRPVSAPTVADIGWFTDGARNHDPLTCPACELLRTPARLPAAQELPPIDEGRRAPDAPTLEVAPQLVAESSLRSRAPPQRLIRV